MKRLLAFLVWLVVVTAAPAAQPPAKPNLVVILADDYGWGSVGCYGAIGVKTPHLDRLAQEGRRFTLALHPVDRWKRRALRRTCRPAGNARRGRRSENARLIEELKAKLKQIGPFEPAEDTQPKSKKQSKRAAAGAELSDEPERSVHAASGKENKVATDLISTPNRERALKRAEARAPEPVPPPRSVETDGRLAHAAL